MSSRTLDACLLAFALLIASCGRAPVDAGTDDGDAAAVSADAGDADQADQDEPPEDVPPATAPDAAAALAAAPAAPGFASALPVPLGAGVAALRAAWPAALDGGPGADAQACYLLVPHAHPAQGQAVQGHGHAFMFEGDRFVRMDVDDAAAVAPGGGRIGMSVAEIDALYPGRVEERPHKYVEGARYLRVEGAAGDAVLLFETDAQGVVRAWRVGQVPQVDYVEGCG